MSKRNDIYIPRDNLECRNLSEVKIMWRDSILARKKKPHTLNVPHLKFNCV